MGRSGTVLPVPLIPLCRPLVVEEVEEQVDKPWKNEDYKHGRDSKEPPPSECEHEDDDEPEEELNCNNSEKNVPDTGGNSLGLNVWIGHGTTLHEDRRWVKPMCPAHIPSSILEHPV